MIINKYCKTLIRRLPYYFISPIFRAIYSPSERIIVCNSSNFTSYSCNPKYITEYILKNCPERYEIYWVFKNEIPKDNIPKEVHVLKLRSFQYFKIIHSAHYVISNQRVDKYELNLLKHPKQKYINTCHGSIPLKYIEKDVDVFLGKTYINRAKYDSSLCDLMLSGCKFFTSIIKSAFWYNGEILEHGTPRCDMLFKVSKEKENELYTKFNIDKTTKVILYAPTFRSNYSLDIYKLEWDDVLTVLKEKTNNDYIVLLKLHPNFYKHKEIDLKKYTTERIIEVSSNSDMQELLIISDILVTDYSSCMFEFSLLKKPCFLFAKDADSYERGTYFKLEDLPYPLARTTDELLENMLHYNNNRNDYYSRVDTFLENKIGNYENGNACEHLLDWMNKH